MDENKPMFYIVAIIGIVAIVILLILAIDTKVTPASSGTENIGAAIAVKNTAKNIAGVQAGSSGLSSQYGYNCVAPNRWVIINSVIYCQIGSRYYEPLSNSIWSVRPDSITQ